MMNFANVDPLMAYFLSAAGMKAIMTYLCYSPRPDKAKAVAEVSELLLYPLKSGQAVTLQSMICTSVGAKHPSHPVFDRTLIVINSEQKFISGRQEPKLTTISVDIDETQLQLRDGNNRPPLTVSLNTVKQDSKLVTVNVWGTNAQGIDLGNEAANWISAALGKPGDYRLLYHVEGCKKRALEAAMEYQFYSWTSRKGTKADKVMFQDGYPYLLASDASLSDINQKLTKPITMRHMRPNIVVTGCGAFEEDDWSEMWIGNAKFSNVKPCDRCLLTTVDPNKGAKREDMEPLKTLRTYRIVNPMLIKPLFGVNLVLDSPQAAINVGDTVYIMPRQEPL